MATQRVTVIDGPLSPGLWSAADMEPKLVTSSEQMTVLQELLQREPLFHRPECGTTRKDFEQMTDPGFWEVGTSGPPVQPEIRAGWPRKALRTSDRNYLGTG